MFILNVGISTRHFLYFPPKGLYTQDIFAYNIAKKDKKICDKKIILRHRFLLTNQGKLLKTSTYLGLQFV